MADSITVHLQISKCPQLLRFSTDLDETDIKMHGLLRSFILNIVIIRVAYPFNLYESLKVPSIPIQWQPLPPPPPTPHTHNYNTIQNFVDLKIRLNQYQAIKSSICLKPQCSAFAEARTCNPSSSPISHRGSPI